MRLKKNRVFYISLGALIPLFLYCGLWLAASEWSFYKITEIMNSSIGKYVKFDVHALKRDGFPFSITWHIQSAEISAPVVDKKINGRMSGLIFGVNILQPNVVWIKAQNMSFLLKEKTKKEEWKIDLEEISIKINEKIKDIHKMSFELVGMKIAEKIYYPANKDWAWIFKIANMRGQFNPLLSDDNLSRKLTTHLVLKSSDILFNPKKKLHIKKIETAFINLSILGNLKLTGIKDLVDWREEGGIIEIRTAGLNSAPIKLELSGTIGLDQELKPIGAGTILLSGADTIIDKQIKIGKLKDSDAKLIRLALRLLPHKNNSEGLQSIQIPITAQNGELRLGPFLVTKLISLVR